MLNKLNKTFRPHTPARSQDFQDVSDKVDEIIDNLADNKDLQKERQQRMEADARIENLVRQETLARQVADADHTTRIQQLEAKSNNICAIEISDDGDIILTTSDSSNIVSGEMTDDGDIILNINI